MMMQRIMGNDAGQCDRLFVFASARPAAGMEATLVLVRYANMLAGESGLRLREASDPHLVHPLLQYRTLH